MIGAKATVALQKALKEFGLTVTQGNSRYDDGMVAMKFEAALPNVKAASKKQNSALLGFSKNIVGMTFRKKNTVYTITDIHLRKPKYPVIAETQRGAKYKFTVEQIVRYLDGKVKFKGFIPTEPMW